MMQTIRRLQVAPFRPAQHFTARTKRALSTAPTSVRKLPREVPVQARAVHSSLKGESALSAGDTSTTQRHHLTPFPPDKTWPDGVHAIFRTHPLEKWATPNRQYSGPYTTLLTYCFGANSFRFVVAPEAPLLDLFISEDRRLDPKFYVFIIVYDHLRRPVMIADIKEDGWLDRAALRLEADKQMRTWFELMVDDCPLPHLWGLSLSGTSLRVYKCDVRSREIEPAYQHGRKHHILPGNFLEGAWNIDILSQEGFDKMKEIVGEIAKGVAASQWKRKTHRR